VPTPVGPAPRGPNDPDFWDFGDPADLDYRSNGGHGDGSLAAHLQRRRRRRQLMALVVVVVLIVAVLATVL